MITTPVLRPETMMQLLSAAVPTLNLMLVLTMSMAAATVAVTPIVVRATLTGFVRLTRETKEIDVNAPGTRLPVDFVLKELHLLSKRSTMRSKGWKKSMMTSDAFLPTPGTNGALR